eukprot:3573479-Ditylum_brightwellii.AAC.1
MEDGWEMEEEQHPPVTVWTPPSKVTQSLSINFEASSSLPLNLKLENIKEQTTVDWYWDQGLAK